jgi:hypothetical protein
MRPSRFTTPQRGVRLAVALIAGIAVVLGAVCTAPRTSEAASAWLRTPQVRIKQLGVPGGLPVTPLASSSSAPSRSAAVQAPAAGPATIDAGMRFSMAGVVCDTPLGAGAVVVRLRSSLDGASWGRWFEAGLEQSDQTGSAGKSFIDPVWVGAARYVQVSARAAASGAPVVLANVRVSAIDSVEDADAVAAAAGAVRRVAAAVAGISLTQPAAASPAAPAIVTRSQWGADESLRRGSPSYAAVKMAFVHHTASNSEYLATDVPAIMRGIYAYHTQSLGWDDIGYNFLVDRFGTIYEGRYGGVTRGVVGAQVLGFNTGSTGISVIGTYTTAAPPVAAVKSLERLLAWKLSLAGIDPSGTATMTCGYTQKFKAGAQVRLPAIAGHRDANYTECPGDALYALLPAVRTAVTSLTSPAKWLVTLSVSATSIPADGTVTCSGLVTGGGGAPGAGAVTVQRRPAAGGTWVAWRTAKLVAAGRYSVAVRMSSPESWQLRAEMPGDAWGLTGYSSPVSLTVRRAVRPVWRVSLRLSAASAPAGGSVRYSGAVQSPTGRPGSGTVTIQRRLASEGTWRAWRTAKLNATGGYAVRLIMTSRNTWQLRARMSASAGIGAGSSPIKSLDIL